jgi:hypothetical protein
MMARRLPTHQAPSNAQTASGNARATVFASNWRMCAVIVLDMSVLDMSVLDMFVSARESA